MKIITLRTVDKDGNIVKESSLHLKEGSILVMRPPEEMGSSDIGKLHECMSKALEADMPFITVNPRIKFQILEVQWRLKVKIVKGNY